MRIRFENVFLSSWEQMCVEFEKVKKGNVQFFDRLDEATIKLEKMEIHGHNDEYCKYTVYMHYEHVVVCYLSQFPGQ